MSGPHRIAASVAGAFAEASETRVAGSRGRQRKKRPPPLSIRVSDEERARLKQDAAGQSVNSYIRRRLFGAPSGSRRAKTQPPVDRAAIARVLGALGQSRLASNLNQIAKAANMGALPVSPELTQELHRACADIRAMRGDLLKALGVKNP